MCSRHQLPKEMLTDAELKTLRKIPPIMIRTANGWLKITEAATVEISALNITIDCQVNPGKCPPLLGVGKLAREHKIGYLVEDKMHYLLPENGQKMELIVIADVPYLAQNADQPSVTATRATVAPSIEEKITAKHKAEWWEHPEEKADMDEKADVPSPPSAAKVPRPKRRERVNFCTQSHNEFTHFPLDPNCEICQRAKPQRSGVRSKVYGRPDDLPQPKEFGDGITADHAILNDIFRAIMKRLLALFRTASPHS